MLHTEEWDAIRDRVIVDADGELVDGRVYLLRAAERAALGEVQHEVDAAIGDVLSDGVRLLLS
jgi:hypothetical protein